MYRSLGEICKEAAATGCSFWELIQKDDCRERQIAQEESFVQLQRMYQAMKRRIRTTTKPCIPAVDWWARTAASWSTMWIRMSRSAAIFLGA